MNLTFFIEIFKLNSKIGIFNNLMLLSLNIEMQMHTIEFHLLTRIKIRALRISFSFNSSFIHPLKKFPNFIGVEILNRNY